MQYLSCLLGLSLLAANVQATETVAPLDPLLAERIPVYNETAKQLAQAMIGELKSAVAEKGLVEGMDICRQKVKSIAKPLLEGKNFTLRRVSLKNRNENNVPDGWEAEMLAAFETRKAAGEDPAKITATKVSDENGVKTVRYLKAIPTQEMCLACHGEHLTPALTEKIKTLYPNDKAVGFKIGDIRGAFSFTEVVK